jgi:hypothetical protein
MKTTQRIVRVGMLRAGLVSAAIHGFLVVIVGPFVALAALGRFDKPGKVAAVIVGLVLIPVAAFLWGLLAAAIYNVAGRWTGGLEVTLADSDAGAGKGDKP